MDALADSNSSSSGPLRLVAAPTLAIFARSFDASAWSSDASAKSRNKRAGRIGHRVVVNWLSRAADFRTRVAALGIEEVLSAPRSPWQSPYVERLIGSIRRECLENVVVLHQRHLRRILTAYFDHYHRWRCHQALDMDCPEPRPIQSREQGAVVEVTEGSGLYRQYERRAA